MSRIASRTVFAVLVPVMLFFSACSLDYGVQEKKQETYVPEMILSNANFTRIEDSSPQFCLYADQMELFKTENSVYANGVQFSSLDNSGAITSKGSASLLYANNQTDVYTLFGGVEIKNFTENYVLRAENLLWNNTTEQAVSGKNDIVSITRTSPRGDSSLSVQGRGFSASAFNLEYRFTEAVAGVITAEDE